MIKYNVSGMTCAACSSRVQKAVEGVEGVSSCSVNLLTNTMFVEGDVSAEKIMSAVEKAGYGASLPATMPKETNTKEKKDNSLVLRLVFSSVFLAALMYISMCHVMWGAPLPSLLSNNPIGLGLIELLLSSAVMIINQRFFINGFKGLVNLTPNMDTLVSLGSLSAFLYSVVLLFSMGGMTDVHNMHAALHGLYFESAAMVLTLITLGKLLESRAKGKTTNSIRRLMALTPKIANLIKDGKEITVQIDEVRVGDIFVVRPGDSIPVDGEVLEGKSAVDESALTGESIPVDKEVGATVSAGTINKFGILKCEARRVGEDTALSQIIKIVNDAASSKAPIAKIADRVSGVFVPIVILISIITFCIWSVASGDIGYSLARAISVLVISCPCALGLATPVAIMVGSGMGAKHGILFKNATALENLGKTKTVVLDKTGTITEGKPRITDVICSEHMSEQELLSIAVSVEKNSGHPLARAICDYGKEKGIVAVNTDAFEYLTGSGIKAKINQADIYAGNLELVSTYADISDEFIRIAEKCASEGKTSIFFVGNKKLLGVIALIDRVRSDSKNAIVDLKNMGIDVIMLTGDNVRTAMAIGKEIGIENIIAEVKPDKKEEKIRELQKIGRVCMVGDGINDAPALTRADIGVAIGNGTDVAIESADVVIANNRLSDLVSAIKLSRSVIRNIYENLFWAFGYNIIGIPLAAGLFIPILGWELEPMFSAAAMSISSFLVVSNALRLNYTRLNKKSTKENKMMKKTVYITGMMCMHCEARVKKLLEGTDGISSAEVSHTQGTAVITLSKDISDKFIKEMIESDGYTVTDIK